MTESDDPLRAICAPTGRTTAPTGTKRRPPNADPPQVVRARLEAMRPTRALSTMDVAEIAGVTRSTVLLWIKQGRLVPELLSTAAERNKRPLYGLVSHETPCDRERRIDSLFASGWVGRRRYSGCDSNRWILTLDEAERALIAMGRLDPAPPPRTKEGLLW